MTLRDAEPDPWYSVHIQVEAKSLPPGVEFRLSSIPGVDQPYFSNSGATPFYLVTTPKSPPNWVRDLPSNVIPTRMAVSGVTFRIESTLDWSRDIFPGILVERFIRIPSGQDVRMLEMDAYLGKEKIAIRGQFVTGRVNRLELAAPLPAPLRLVEVQTGRFAIANDGPVPLYTGFALPKPVGWATEVPFGFLATHKLVAGKTYYGERVLPSSADGWKDVAPEDARIDADTFESYVPGVKIKQIRRDNRPAGAKAPDPLHFSMTAFHGTRRVAIRGRILYELNPDYDPKAGQRPPVCASCTGSTCGGCPQTPPRPAVGNPAPKRAPTY